jgi:predicted nucleic acid-binding protein
MNVAEIYGGMRPGEETQIQKLLDSVRILPVTFAVAKRAGELRSTRALLGRTHSIQDMIVAATALENGLTLVTHNRKDFPIEGLTFWP